MAVTLRGLHPTLPGGISILRVVSNALDLTLETCRYLAASSAINRAINIGAAGKLLCPVTRNRRQEEST